MAVKPCKKWKPNPRHVVESDAESDVNSTSETEKESGDSVQKSNREVEETHYWNAHDKSTFVKRMCFGMRLAMAVEPQEVDHFRHIGSQRVMLVLYCS